MDTVTEARMAIAMAQSAASASFIAISIPRPAAQVRQVKKYESGGGESADDWPDATLSDALALMKIMDIGIPVVTGASTAGPAKLVGILTNRDVRFATDPSKKSRS